MFSIIFFGIKQLNKLWKKTFYSIEQLLCFVGHPVCALCTVYNYTCCENFTLENLF